MSSDLVKLYKELKAMEQSPDIVRVKSRIEERLDDKLKENFLELLEIGGAIGYDKLQAEMERAVQLIGKIRRV